MNIPIKRDDKKINITSPQEVANLLSNILMTSEEHDRNKEHFYIICLDVRNRILNIDLVSLGTLTASLVHPREVYKIAIMKNAAQVIVSHNHPSNDPEPSEDDIRITKRIYEAGKILGIELIDHIIITENKESFTSLKDKGIF
jgi:DNA repair protein RadC